MGLEKILDEAPLLAKSHGFPDLADDFVNHCYLEWAEKGKPDVKWRFDFSWHKFYSKMFGSKGIRRECYFSSENAKYKAMISKEGDVGDLFDGMSKSLFTKDLEEERPYHFKTEFPLIKNKLDLKLFKKTLIIKNDVVKEKIKNLKPLKIDWIYFELD